MKKFIDSLSREGSIVFHSTRSSELFDILVSRKFRAGRGGGAMLGPGFYANQHLYQAKKGNYGPLILKARLLNVPRFFFADIICYNEYFGKSVSSYRELWDAQVSSDSSFSWVGDRFAQLDKRPAGQRSQSNMLSTIWGYLKSLGFQGIVYYGDYDKESIVTWVVSNVIPIAVSFDKGETWTDPKEAIRSKVASNFEVSKQENIASKNEYQRSIQRALDLKKRLAGKDDDTVFRHISNQLSRISDPLKFEIRIDAFKEVFPQFVTQLDKLKHE